MCSAPWPRAVSIHECFRISHPLFLQPLPEGIWHQRTPQTLQKKTPSLWQNRPLLATHMGGVHRQKGRAAYQQPGARSCCEGAVQGLGARNLPQSFCQLPLPSRLRAFNLQWGLHAAAQPQPNITLAHCPMLSEPHQLNNGGEFFSTSAPAGAGQISKDIAKPAYPDTLFATFQRQVAYSGYIEASQKVTKIPLKLWDT